MKEKFSRIRSPWNRLYITFLVILFLCRDKLIRRRTHAHWIGSHSRHTPWEYLLFALLFLGAMVILDSAAFAFWATLVGGATSLFVVMTTIYTLIPRKRI